MSKNGNTYPLLDEDLHDELVEDVEVSDEETAEFVVNKAWHPARSHLQ